MNASFQDLNKEEEVVYNMLLQQCHIVIGDKSYARSDIEFEEKEIKRNKMTTGSKAWDKWFKDLQHGAEISRNKIALNKVRKKTTAELLMNKLEVYFGEPVSLPKRLYHGHLQRSSGAWSWHCVIISNQQAVGSQETMSHCLKLNNEELDNAIEY